MPPPSAHPLSAPGRLLCRADDYLPYPPHHPAASHAHPHPHHAKPPGPYHDVMLLDGLGPSGCPCRDCCMRREESAFHALRLERGESLHWEREGLRRGSSRGDVPLHWEREREAADLQWERDREADYWHRRATVSAYGPQGHDLAAFTFDPLPSGHPAYPEPTHSHSHLDMKYSSSSGYQTPRQACPYSPYQPSPSESRGYASGYQSESTSPLPPPNNCHAPSGHPEAHSQAYPPDTQPDGHPAGIEGAHWRDHMSHGSLRGIHREAHVPCSTPSDMSGPPTPVHTSSPLRTQESPSLAARDCEGRSKEALSDSTPAQPQSPARPQSGPQEAHSPSQGSPKDRAPPSTDPCTPTQAAPEALGPSSSSSSSLRPLGQETHPIASGSPSQPSPMAVVLPDHPQNHAHPLEDATQAPQPQPQPPPPPLMDATAAVAPVPRAGTESTSLPSPPAPASAPAQPHGGGGGGGGSCPPEPVIPKADSAPSSPQPPHGSQEGSPTAEAPVPGFATLGRRLMLASEPVGHLQHCSSMEGIASARGSPASEGTSTPTFPPLSSGYYQPAGSLGSYSGHPGSGAPQPPLPEKRRQGTLPGSPNGRPGSLRPGTGNQQSVQHHVTFSPSVGEVALPASQSEGALTEEELGNRVSVKFVQDSSRFWYKPGISRDQAIAALKEREPGTFLIRDSNSFQGAYGLALKVATPPPNANSHSNKADPLEQLVRHFLIETGPRGVKIKGCQNEPYFGSLSALVYQHSITPISLPCGLRIPEKDLLGDIQEVQPVSNLSTAADLLKQGAACNVLYLNSVETESLTGPQAIAKATSASMSRSPRPAATVVHFKVSAQGITLTDSQRRVFFRRHYPLNSVTFSSIDPQDRRWTNSDSTTSKVFGFVAKKPGSVAENVCHLFAELDPEQPASAIVNFINKVMLAPQRR